VNEVHSSDGTAIAFDRLGDGPPVVLVCGASTDRMENAPLAKLLAECFTVFNYDRRGRGDSVPDGRHRTLEGQEHNVDPDVLAPVLMEFFKVQNATL